MLKKIALSISSLILIVIAYASWVGASLMQPWVAFESIPTSADLQVSSQHYDDTASTLIHELDAKLPLWRQETGAPSISIALGYRGARLWSGTAGYRDLSQPLAADRETLYRIGSTSKALTSTALARLYQQGLIELDRPIGDYLADLPTDKKAITLRQLMSHAAGIRHYRDLWLPPFQEYYFNKRFDSVEDAVQVFINDPLHSKPGESFSYSSYGFNLVSRVMEAATGKPFPKIVEDEVLKPLNMQRTFAEGLTTPENMAQWYLLSDEKNKVKQARETDNSVKWAGGGFVSTPEDLVSMGSAWLNPDFISNNNQSMFFEPQRLSNGEINPQSYALGWRSERKAVAEFDNEMVYFVHHGGTANGSTTYLVVYPEKEIVVAASMNGLGHGFKHIATVAFETAGLADKLL